MMGRCLGVLLLTVLSTACGVTARSSRPGTLSARPSPSRSVSGAVPSCQDLDSASEGARVCAIAQIDARSGTVDVLLRVEPEALPRSRTEVTLVRGGEVEPLGRVEEAVEIRYRVELDQAEGSFRRPGGWHVAGRSILPEIHVDGAAASVAATLLIEVGVPLYTSAGSDRRVFDAPSLARLANESYEVGALAMTRRDVDDVTLWIGSSSLPDGALEGAADVLADAFRRLRDHLGPSPTDTVLITFHPSPAPFRARDGSTVVWSMTPDADPLVELASGLRPLAHLWIPGTRSIAEAWLREGVPEHYAALVANAMLGGQPDALARGVVRSWSRSAAAAEGRTLRSGDDAWVTDAGAVAGFCLDGTLHESSSSLDAVLRRALARGDSLSTESLLEDLAAVAPEAAGHLAALVETSGAFAIDECLEREGFTYRETRFRPWSDATLSEIVGATLSEATSIPMLRVGEVVEGSPLETGDLVMRVHGQPTAQLVDLAWALRDASAGDHVELLVHRSGEARSLTRVVPELAEAEQGPERAYLELLRSEAAP